MPYAHVEFERELTSIRSHCEDCGDPGHHHQVTTTEVYPDNPNDHVIQHKSSNKHKSPLVWGEDILFLDQRQHDSRTEGEAGTSHYSRTVRSVDQESKTVLQRQLQQCDDGQDGNNKLELTVTNMVSLAELSDMSVMEPDKYISLSGFNFFPKDEETEDLNDICSSLQLGGMVETHPCTVDEIQQSSVSVTPAPEDPPPSGRMGLRRTRNASRRMSVLNGDDNSFCSQTESVNENNNRKRNMSEHSIVSAGSYDDPDSPYNSSGRRKRRRYEEDPSNDPAFEKSRKNAIIAKRNREKKKQLMEQMESRCDKLSTQNEMLDSDNGKLRHRVQTLEEEVFYLKSVLANQSALSGVLSTLKSVDQLRFSSSFEASKYNKKGISSSSTHSRSSSSSGQLKVSGGICLHVDGNQVSMEMCAKCAQVWNLYP